MCTTAVPCSRCFRQILDSIEEKKFFDKKLIFWKFSKKINVFDMAKNLQESYSDYQKMILMVCRGGLSCKFLEFRVIGEVNGGLIGISKIFDFDKFCDPNFVILKMLFGFLKKPNHISFQP